MDINEINSLLDRFLKQERIFEPQYKSFQVKLVATVGNDINTKNYLIGCFKLISGFFKDGVYIGKKTIDELKNPHNTKEKATQKSSLKIAKINTEKLKQITTKKEKKEKYIVPPSKNKLTAKEAILLKLKIEYVRKKYTILSFAEELQFDKESLLEVIKSCGFKDLNYQSLITIDHIAPISEQVFDKRNKIMAYESEVVSKNPKTKPNYFKLIYNSPGSKR